MSTEPTLPKAHRLRPVKATPESLQGYGYVIGEPDDSVRSKIDFYGDDVVVTQPAKFHGNDDLCLNLVSFNPRPLQVRWMEYHTKHTQTFIPLSGKPFYMVLGKPTARRRDGSWDDQGTDLPNLTNIQAFEFDGSAGLVMDIGVWHEVPFPRDGRTQFICICTNETNSNLETGDSQGECTRGDLTKKNIHAQLGTVIEIDTDNPATQS